jgi:hypothetical protein
MIGKDTEGEAVTPHETAGTDEMARAQQLLFIHGPPVGSRWRHFKGGEYVVTKLSVMEDTLDPLVTYVSEKTGYEITRTLAVFLGVHPGHHVKRFEQIE